MYSEEPSFFIATPKGSMPRCKPIRINCGFLPVARAISSADLNRIAAYMNCSVECLVPADLAVEGADDGKTSSVIPNKDCILNILEKLAGNAAYRYLQVIISSIIISNLAKKNITMDKLIDINLSEKKIRDLYDLAMPAEKKKGLNFSDLMRISEAFNVSYDFMLTGNGE